MSSACEEVRLGGDQGDRREKMGARVVRSGEIDAWGGEIGRRSMRSMGEWWESRGDALTCIHALSLSPPLCRRLPYRSYATMLKRLSLPATASSR